MKYAEAVGSKLCYKCELHGGSERFWKLTGFQALREAINLRHTSRVACKTQEGSQKDRKLTMLGLDTKLGSLLSLDSTAESTRFLHER